MQGGARRQEPSIARRSTETRNDERILQGGVRYKEQERGGANIVSILRRSTEREGNKQGASISRRSKEIMSKGEQGVSIVQRRKSEYCMHYMEQQKAKRQGQ